MPPSPTPLQSLLHESFAMDEDFADADADATLTIPLRAGELKKGSYVVMSRDKPCQVRHGTGTGNAIPTATHVHALAAINANAPVPCVFFSLPLFTARPPPNFPPFPQVMSISTSKTGKHGHAKASFVAMDIFTGRRYEDSQPTSHNVAVPVGEFATCIRA